MLILRRALFGLILCGAIAWPDARPALAAGADSPKDLLQKLTASLDTSNAQQVTDLIDQSSPDGKQLAALFSAMIQSDQAKQAFHRALTDKFGPDAVAALKQSSRIKTDNPIADMRDKVNQAQINQIDDRAVLSIPGEDEPLPLIRKSGKWYLDDQQIMAQTQGMMGPMAAMLGAHAQLMREGKSLVSVSDSIEGLLTKFKPKTDQFATVMMMAMMQAMAQGASAQAPVAQDLQPQMEQEAAKLGVQTVAMEPDPSRPYQIVLAIEPTVVESDPDAAALWADFNHYVRIARPDLAGGAAERLLAMVDEAQLLAVVEAGDYKNWQKTLRLAQQIKSLSNLAEQLGQRIQAARIGKSRDPKRIADDLERLAGTLRQRLGAIDRLRGAGQFAAPQLLDVLLDQKKTRLHPHVETAMIAIGRPLVYPLSVALGDLEPVQMGQVAQVLAEIGYPRALPYLKQVLEDSSTDPDAQQIVQTAYDRLAESAGVTADLWAADLHLTIGENYYASGTTGEHLAGHDPTANKGIAWTYSRQSGLLAIPVPAEIFADVLAMRAARQALILDAQMDPALSLWLTANLRRENRLPPGQADHSYSAPRQPSYYARMAGPLRLHDILDRALGDADGELALDAIAALQATAGTDALINRQGAVQPLLRALAYPDRRVRFPAAFVMTQARPTQPFEGSHRVAVVLAEAVRQSELRHALLLADDQETLNAMMADLQELGYEVTGGLSLEAASDPINSGPGFDLIVTGVSAARVEVIVHQTAENYKLAAAPILAIVSAADQNTLAVKFKDERRLHTALIANRSDDLRAAAEQVARSAAGKPITREQAAEYASTALTLLREIALSQGDVYQAADAEPALIGAINDQRQTIVMQSGRVLELIDSQPAQLAIAQGALDEGRTHKVRISLLNSLAESAENFGNKLGQIQLDLLLELVKTTDGDFALAAARAHGALALPTSNVVEMIVQ